MDGRPDLLRPVDQIRPAQEDSVEEADRREARACGSPHQGEPLHDAELALRRTQQDRGLEELEGRPAPGNQQDHRRKAAEGR